eukprot:scaffold17660_cov116-Isochrysis_galbana.AAC.4
MRPQSLISLRRLRCRRPPTPEGVVAAQCLLRRLYCSCPVWACADQHCIAQQRLEIPQHWQRLWREARIRRAETRTTILLSTWPQVCPAAPRLSTGATLRDEPTAPQ